MTYVLKSLVDRLNGEPTIDIGHPHGWVQAACDADWVATHPRIPLRLMFYIEKDDESDAV